LDAVVRQSVRARDKRTNGERANRRDFGFYFLICQMNLTQQTA
jgi:hypothetical protein